MNVSEMKKREEKERERRVCRSLFENMSLSVGIKSRFYGFKERARTIPCPFPKC